MNLREQVKAATNVALKKKEDTEMQAIIDKANELYISARGLIDYAAEEGKFETTLCVRFEDVGEELTQKRRVLLVVADRLKGDGFDINASTNHAFKEIMLNISWK
jgi:hypothetical protein